MYAKCVSGEEWKRGGKEQHSKIRPVNHGEDVADVAEAWLCVGRGDETDTNARCGGAAGAQERGKRAADLALHTRREIEPQMGSMLLCSEN